MPKRAAPHLGTSTSPHLSSSSLNEVASILARTKATIAQIEPYKSPSNVPRRPSFSMDSLLHPHKDRNKRNDSKERRNSMHGEKRHSLSMRASSKSKDASSSPRLAPHAPAKFDMVIESPPLVFYGGVSNSTGALLSGRLRLKVDDPTGQVQLTTFTMKLQATITTKRPLQKDCYDCRERHDNLKEWKFLTEPKTCKRGDDIEFPFSHLLPGHLPASTSATLGSVAYQLHASATTSTADVIDFVHPLIIQRAIPPGPDRSSIRIFPPTNLTSRFVLPPVVHPIGTFPIQMTLSGVVEQKQDHQLRWRLRKMMWRIEEHTKMISAPCSRHGTKLGEGKGVQHEDIKTLGSEEMKSGWKTDFDTAGGEIMLEFEAALSTRASHKAVCDVESPAGLDVKHTLVVELIVGEEFCPNRNPHLITPTGAARVLRMQFALVVTERAGMGISWDEEMPPMYEDVPESPPGYGSADRNEGAFGGAVMIDYEGPELEYEDLEVVPSRNPNDPPVYRARDPALVASAAGPSRPPPRFDSMGSSDQDLRPHPVERVRGGRLTEDDFGFEPPQYSLGGREPSDSSERVAPDDIGEGSASAAPNS